MSTNKRLHLHTDAEVLTGSVRNTHLITLKEILIGVVGTHTHKHPEIQNGRHWMCQSKIFIKDSLLTALYVVCFSLNLSIA